MNNTTPEQRPDKNGKIVTRHVRANTAPAASTSKIPVPSLPSSSPESSNFAEMNDKQLKSAIDSIVSGISPETLWDSFDALTRAAKENTEPSTFVRHYRDSSAMTKLRDTWLDMNGADIADREVYSHIEGENGYEKYTKAYAALSQMITSRSTDKDFEEIQAKDVSNKRLQRKEESKLRKQKGAARKANN